MLTTNKGIREWPEILADDEVLAREILDRLLQNTHVLAIKGRSCRLRDLGRAVTQQAWTETEDLAETETTPVN